MFSCQTPSRHTELLRSQTSSSPNRIPNTTRNKIAILFGIAGASGKGGDFVETMIAKAKKNELISVVDDMHMSPAYARDAALVIQKIIKSSIPYRTYHVTDHSH